MSVDRWPPAILAVYKLITTDLGDDFLVCPTCGGRVRHPNRDPSPQVLRHLLHHARVCKREDAKDKVALREGEEG
jgi:hypothetical protein